MFSIEGSYLVVLEHSELDLLPLVLVLLGSGVGLLLPLLSTTTQPQHQMQSGLLKQTVHMLVLMRMMRMMRMRAAASVREGRSRSTHLLDVVV